MERMLTDLGPHTAWFDVPKKQYNQSFIPPKRPLSEVLYLAGGYEKYGFPLNYEVMPDMVKKVVSLWPKPLWTT